MLAILTRDAGDRLTCKGSAPPGTRTPNPLIKRHQAGHGTRRPGVQRAAPRARSSL